MHLETAPLRQRLLAPLARRTRDTHRDHGARRERRGSALMLTLVFTFALGGLAISAIYMAGSSSILSKLYDRERDYRYAAEWALAVGNWMTGAPETLWPVLTNCPVPRWLLTALTVSVYTGPGDVEHERQFWLECARPRTISPVV
jgi:hypothetical protein